MDNVHGAARFRTQVGPARWRKQDFTSDTEYGIGRSSERKSSRPARLPTNSRPRRHQHASSGLILYADPSRPSRRFAPQGLMVRATVGFVSRPGSVERVFTSGLVPTLWLPDTVGINLPAWCFRRS